MELDQDVENFYEYLNKKDYSDIVFFYGYNGKKNQMFITVLYTIWNKNNKDIRSIYLPCIFKKYLIVID